MLTIKEQSSYRENVSQFEERERGSEDGLGLKNMGFEEKYI